MLKVSGSRPAGTQDKKEKCARSLGIMEKKKREEWS